MIAITNASSGIECAAVLQGGKLVAEIYRNGEKHGGSLKILIGQQGLSLEPQEARELVEWLGGFTW